MELLVFLVDSPVISALAKSLLHFLWQGAAIAFALYLGLNAISKRQSELRYVVSLAAMGLCVAAPVSTFFWFYQPVSQVTIEQVSPAVLEMYQSQAQALASSSEVAWNWLDWNLLLGMISVFWLIGVIYLSVHLIFELIKVYQLPRRDVIEPQDEITQVFENLKKRLHVSPITKLLVSLQAEVPMVVGFIKPVVLVPFSMASGLSSAQLEMLLAHELAHVNRHDYLINFVQTLVSILLFFHPLVKWISLQIRIEREYCCDDIAVQTCGNVKAYATALTDAESLRSHHIPQLAMAATAGDLKGRVVRMIEHTDCASKSSRSWHSMVLASLAAIGLAVMLFSAHAGYQTRIVEVLHDELQEPPAIVKLDNDSLARIQLSASIDMGKLKPSPSQANAPIARATVQSDKTKAKVIETRSPVVEQVAQVEAKAPIQTENVRLQTVAKSTIRPAAEAIMQGDIKDPASVVVATELRVANNLEASKQGLAEPVELSLHELAPAIGSDNSDKTYNGQNSSYQTTQIAKPRLNSVTVQNRSAERVSDEDERAALVSIVAPSLVRNARPNYPRTAIARKIEADVKVSFVVDTTGRISNIAFQQNVPGYFKRSIRKALKHWRFDPGSIGGKASEMTLTRVFSFRDPKAEVGEETTLRVTGSRISKQI